MKMKNLSKFFAAFLCAAIILPCFGNEPVRAASGVSIDAEFPDPIFRAYIKSAFDSNKDNYLSDDEIYWVRNIHCENMGVTSVEGIENFPYLVGLWCKGNNISDWDLSSNKELTGVWCSFNDFEYLDFTGCPKLEWVYCFNCNLKSLNVSNNPEMAFIECNANKDLKSLDLSKNYKLENLFASECGLTSLNLSNNPRLCELAAFKNNLKTVDLSHNTNLKRLDIWDNPNLGNVDVSKLPGLQYYNCAKTKMTKVDVTHNPELVELVASYNSGLTSLDLSKNPKLAYLNVECDVNLKKLDVSHNPRLFHLYAFGMSSIDSIDISKNSRLCKAYNEGAYVHETQNLGYVYSQTLNYGGSGDPFDDLLHIVVFDDRANINGTYNGTNDVIDSVIDTNDGHSNSEQFITRGEAIQALYEKVGSPAVRGTSRFTDVAGSPYANAIKWGEDRNICLGYPNISSDTFCPNELISRQDFALMAHRYATALKLGTAFDYGRTDWFDDFYNIDFYAWGAFTWSIQFGVLKPTGNMCYPRGRMNRSDLTNGVNTIFNLDGAASYSEQVGGNYGADYTPPASPTQPTTPAPTKRPTPTKPAPTKAVPTQAPATATPVPTKDPERMPRATSTPTPAPRATVAPATATAAAKATPTVAPTTAPVAKPVVDDGAKVTTVPADSGAKETPEPKVPGTMVMTDDEDTIDEPAAPDVSAPATSSKPASEPQTSETQTTEPADPKAKTLEFVERIYRFVLDREPEEEGAAYWSDELWAFRRTGAEVAQSFIFSDEFNARNTTNEEFVTILYKTFFGRDPEEEGFNYWVDQLKNGAMDRTTVANGFIFSQEWADTCASYGIRSGGELKPTGTIAPTELTYAFVERMYTTAMGRSYDEEGRQYWASELANFNATGESCGASFFLSDEMNGYGLSDKEYVGRLYATFMDREADSDGEAYWLGLMASGTKREDVVFGFTRSPEFTDKCVEARILPY